MQSVNERIRDRVMARLGVRSIIFKRKASGKLRHEYSADRVRVWREMHKHQPELGCVMSWQEISEATGVQVACISKAVRGEVRGASGAAEAARDRILAALRITKHVFDRNNGRLHRDRADVEERRSVWRAMRAEGFSLKEIAAACGCSSHSGVIHSLRVDASDTLSTKQNPTDPTSKASSSSPLSSCAA